MLKIHWAQIFASAALRCLNFHYETLSSSRWSGGGQRAAWSVWHAGWEAGGVWEQGRHAEDGHHHPAGSGQTLRLLHQVWWWLSHLRLWHGWIVSFRSDPGTKSVFPVSLSFVLINVCYIEHFWCSSLLTVTHTDAFENKLSCSVGSLELLSLDTEIYFYTVIYCEFLFSSSVFFGCLLFRSFISVCLYCK